ncbi:MAG: helix-turn-helix transcriptional regulator [Pyrinomonadaceae bacterium]|nr:helix-turn-helix transcriptional regulator [Pyrinomonadaceae bacterium]MDQ3134641.1 helix-turn-helix domain-containing protein [Acidobacteriota bacterium]
MGYARPRPKRLAEKLLQIRNALGLSQTDLWRRLGVEDEISHKLISKYELDQNEPPLKVLLQYARVAGVHTEALIDDNLDLPYKLPGDVRHEEIKRKYIPRGKKR